LRNVINNRGLIHKLEGLFGFVDLLIWIELSILNNPKTIHHAVIIETSTLSPALNFFGFGMEGAGVLDNFSCVVVKGFATMRMVITTRSGKGMQQLLLLPV